MSLNWVAACIVATDGRWLVRRVDEGPILSGLWLPPIAVLEDGADPMRVASELVPLGRAVASSIGRGVRHNITHRKIDVAPCRFDVGAFDPPTTAWRWVDPEKPGLPTSSLFGKLVASVAR